MLGVHLRRPVDDVGLVSGSAIVTWMMALLTIPTNDPWLDTWHGLPGARARWRRSQKNCVIGTPGGSSLILVRD